MNKSESIKSLTTALCEAQFEMKKALKKETNPHFKSKYAPLEEVIECCKEALHSNGLCVMQGTEVKDGQLGLETLLSHKSGEWICSFLPLFMSNENAQAAGSAITYARRYALSAMLGIATEDDDDGSAASQNSSTNKKDDTQTSKPPTKKINAQQARELLELLVDDPEQKKNIEAYILKRYKAKTFEEIPEDKFESLKNSIMMSKQQPA